MLRLMLALTAAIALAFVASSCDSDEESLPNDATPTTIADAITICPRIGIAGEATPSSPTPESSCKPGDDFTAPPGVSMTIGTPPALPTGFAALTAFYEIDFDQPVAGTIGVPSIYQGNDSITVFTAGTFAWYTYEASGWVRLDNTVSVIQSAGGTDGLYSGAFDPLPPNLILLAEQ